MNNGIDVVGHMKLVNGQSIIETPVLDEVEIARARHVLWTYDEALPLGPGCKRLLQKKIKSYENTPTVLLVMTVKTKSLGGTLVLTSMSSSRVFMDYDVQPTIDYYWLGPNPQSAEWVNAEVVTKRETLTIGEIYSYIKQGSTKEAFFECTATIDDVVHGSTWYYISCSSYHTKATKGPTSLMCSKCGKVNIAGVAQYRAQIFVYDNSEQAVFVLLGDAGYDYFEHNLEGKSRSLTVTKILPLDTPAATEYSEETFETGINVCEASKVSVDSAEGIKRTCCIDEMGKAKCLKGGN
ncbi:BnaUnng03520D [Brassica napus]|uniref:BnaUnng03520D protein n=2 Tax=Brassica TaxID=3705 RepID=A0A078JQQ9_BRANA|nr:BnaUnng03520D [Brassica napus]VDD37566.1 unnamed protein product [Brassica oleracea]